MQGPAPLQHLDSKGDARKPQLMSGPAVWLQGPAMVDGKYPPAFPLRHQKKDMGLAEELGKATSQPLKVANAAHELYAQVSPLLSKTAMAARAKLTAGYDHPHVYSSMQLLMCMLHMIPLR